VPLPGLPPAGGGLVELVSFSETTGLLAGGSETTRFAVLQVILEGSLEIDG